MTIPERAKFILAMVSNDQLMIPAPLARKLGECQDWLESMAETDADPREKIDHDKGDECGQG